MRTHLHLTGSNVLVIVLHHVGEEGHVIGHAEAAVHFDWLTGKQAVGTAASHPYQQCQAHPQRARHQHRDDWLVVSVDFFFFSTREQVSFWLSMKISWPKLQIPLVHSFIRIPLCLGSSPWRRWGRWQVKHSHQHSVGLACASGSQPGILQPENKAI